MLLTVTLGRLYLGVTKEQALSQTLKAIVSASSEKRMSLNKLSGSRGNMRE
jgi:hypothetical protein